MAGVEVEITGLDEALKKMAQLSNQRQVKNAATRAARKAIAIVRDAAKQNAKHLDDPATREAIYENITMSSGKTRNSNSVRMRVGIMGGAATNKDSKNIVFKERRKKGQPKQEVDADSIALPGGNTRYWRHLEFGTSQIPATPFMRPALANNIQKVTDKFAESFSLELDKELLK
ncbi:MULTISPECIES: HK97-gp10 family putative phage morphogenesis protein [unclassified Acinetobacter]|uniref:HK97-gp10 family putative phage morphogenesis protein n=1 Tax=unclassified Acinetobacter TaxID=196816 RepID=UPI001F4B6D1C|nr:MULTISPECIES: HK97-gp10 family putative phage morphogenesis protein [unclassified Acinetobacter]MCH7353268.1 HK97 gp10 family phage protein [Acinetobacter sp. NIPH 2023]MCH7360650.1 HK97 gp10 family phage protein [Acinetobacter sp. NIPH 2024]